MGRRACPSTCGTKRCSICLAGKPTGYKCVMSCLLRQELYSALVVVCQILSVANCTKKILGLGKWCHFIWEDINCVCQTTDINHGNMYPPPLGGAQNFRNSLFRSAHSFVSKVLRLVNKNPYEALSKK